MSKRKRTKIPYADLHHVSEDDRIQTIGQKVMRDGLTCGFIVEDEAKADRYMAKLKEKFPGIVEEARTQLTPVTILVRVKSTLSKN